MEETSFKLDLDNPEFQRAFQLLTKTNVNVFLTGKAGTGKSTFLKYICKQIKKNFVVLAPTGVAAVNIGGVTIHSFFQMPLRPVPPDDPDYSVKSFWGTKRLSRRKKQIIKELDLIIIDEVSMVRADMIDFLDRVLRGVRRKRGVPFGGVQLLLVGDIFQLEPVVTSDTRVILGRYYQDFFFFNAMAYNQVRLVAVELKKMYRQNDTSFIELLDRVRLNCVSDNDLKVLNSRINLVDDWYKNDNRIEDQDFNITLASRRDAVTAINNEKMAFLEGEERVYEGIIEDDFPEKILPTDLSLVLKVGAQVMLLRNDREKRWVNGTLAKVKEMCADYVMVELENGGVERVEREVWENINYVYDEEKKKVVEEVIGRFSQFPLKAAWALTIHKSQGLTFSKVTIDMGGGAFTPGQTYVALSRCRSLEGLHFINPLNRYDIIVSKGAKDFSRKFNDVKEADLAMREAEAEVLSYDAKNYFANCEMDKAAEAVWRIHNLTGALARSSVRRLISRILYSIAFLKRKIAFQEDELRKARKEIVKAAKILRKNGQAADDIYKLYNSALAIDANDTDALLGMAEVKVENGVNKEAKEFLYKVVKAKDKNFIEASLLLGDLYAAEDDIAEASVNYQNAAKKSKKDKRPIRRLIELYEKHDMEEVAQQCREWLE